MKGRIRVACCEKRAGLAIFLVTAIAAWPVNAQEVEPLDLEAIALIRDEAMQRSQVMETAWYITDLYGPRLTGSTNLRAAAEWARDRMTEWGLTDARLEGWGPFGPGWDNERFYAHVLEPQPYPLLGFPKAWTPGTDGLIRGEATLAPIGSLQDFERFRGALKGKFVLTDVPIPFEHDSDPEPWPSRHSDEALDEFAHEPVVEPFPRERWV